MAGALEIRSGLVVLVFLMLSKIRVSFSAYAHAPDIDRRRLSGIWRLTNEKSVLPSSPLAYNMPFDSDRNIKFRIKEFTVYPKKETPRKKSREKKLEEPDDTLLLLNEDGSFAQYKGLHLDKRKDAEESHSSVAGLAFLKGTWDYLEGKLILATDRPKDVDPKEVHDTILSGRVVAKSEQQLQQEPPPNVLPEPQNSSGGAELSSEVDINLSVPKGSIKVGKFMYPKLHPNFFDQPMVQPTKTGSFSLRQVLGSFSTQPEQIPVEKYQPGQLFNKTFLLTSCPIPSYAKKSSLKWSKLAGKYVPESAPKKNYDDVVIDIRVMKIKFFSNYTFSTLLSSDPSSDYSNQKLLRGKWNIIGEEKDHLWFQVWIFGFGRSVSGSTFSEGKALTQDDARIYRGTVIENHIYNSRDDTNITVFEVSGSVLIGAGLEPQPIGQFTMVELTMDDDEDRNDIYDDDKDEDDIDLAEEDETDDHDYSKIAFQ